MNATVRLIGEKHGEPSPSVSFTYQLYAEGAKRRSHQVQSRFAWMKSIRTFRARLRRTSDESPDALSASVARLPPRPSRFR